ncbi:MAG: hypothetical protein AAF492_13275 [Verrucomicrobiota bacterium]
MAVLILVIGCAMVLIVSYLMLALNNPAYAWNREQIRAHESLSGEMKPAPAEFFARGAESRPARYLDVYPDRFVIYSGSTEQLVMKEHLERTGNAFEKLLTEMIPKKDDERLVFLVRPEATVMARRLRRAAAQCGLEVGVQLFENERRVDLDAMGQLTRVVDTDPVTRLK